jgi:hypothetical protein
MNRKFCYIALMFLVAAALLLPALPAQAQQNAYLQQRFVQEPSAAWMALDTLTFRPVGVVGTVGGIGLFMGTLPLTLATGTAGDASRAFIEQPARWTFQRPLGRRGYDQTFWLP